MLRISLLHSKHPFHANCYMISSGGESAIIDPTAEFDASLIEGELKYIILTHAHFDHILELKGWAENSSAEVIISDDELPALSDPIRNCYMHFYGREGGYFGRAKGIGEDTRLSLGDLEIRMMKTPGHTAGSAIFICGNAAFVGDTVFAGGGYGRFDLPTGDYPSLIASLRRIFDLPDELEVFPGHGDATTIRQIKSDFNR